MVLWNTLSEAYEGGIVGDAAGGRGNRVGPGTETVTVNMTRVGIAKMHEEERRRIMWDSFGIFDGGSLIVCG